MIDIPPTGTPKYLHSRGIEPRSAGFSAPGRLVIGAIALTPFTATLDYGLGTGSVFRMLPPILCGIATIWLSSRTAWGTPKPSLTDLGILAFIACTGLSAAYAIGILGREAAAQAIGFTVVAGHAVFFWLGCRVGELRTVLRMFVLAMLVAGLAGLVQRLLLEMGICTATVEIPARLENRCWFGGALTYAPELGRIRLPGTAASPWHWSWLLVVGAACAPALFSDRQRIWRFVGVVTSTVLVGCSFVSGQRVALVLVPLVALMASFAVLRISNRGKLVAGALLGFLALSVLILPPARDASADLADRWRASPPPQFVVDQWRWAVREKPGLLGHGPGAATSAARHFDDIVLVESVPAKRLFEVGWIGLVSWYLVVGLLAVGILRRWSGACRAARAVSVYVLVLGVMPWWYPTDTDPGNLLFWLFAGMLLREKAE